MSDAFQRSAQAEEAEEQEEEELPLDGLEEMDFSARQLQGKMKRYYQLQLLRKAFSALRRGLPTA